MTNGNECPLSRAPALMCINAPMAEFRPAAPGGELAATRVIQRSRVRDFSDAEAVILLHRDSSS